MRIYTDASLQGKTVLMRLDLDALDKKGKISGHLRLKTGVHSVKSVLDYDPAKIYVTGHIRKPKGQAVEELRAGPVAEYYSEELGFPVPVADCLGPMPEGKVVMLENIRFHPEEESKDTKVREEFARKVLAATGADIFIMDAFATSHRDTQMSVYTAPKLMGDKAYAGQQMMTEVEQMEPILDAPPQPFYVLLGGAKVEDKMGVIGNLYQKAEKFLIGGKMALAFLKAKSPAYNLGAVENDEEFAEDVVRAKKLLEDDADEKIVLPIDVLAAEAIEPDAATQNVEAGKIPAGYFAPDIGEKTISWYRNLLGNAASILHSGPMGVFEMKNFEAGTRELLQYISGLEAITVVGGGDTTAAIEKFGIPEEKFSHVSTGGSAMLEFFSGKELPVLALLGYQHRNTE